MHDKQLRERLEFLSELIFLA